MREIKRVSIDFDWPMGRKWPGFVPPEDGTVTCPVCSNKPDRKFGYTPEATAIAKIVEVIPWDNADRNPSTRAFLDALRTKRQQRHAHRQGQHGPIFDDAARAAYAGVLGFLPDSIGHDLVCVVEEALGISLQCPSCKGEGFVVVDVKQSEIAAAWKPQEPPTGEGWQVWEAVSSGSPITPVYPTAEALVEALVTKGTNYDEPVSRKAAEGFVRAGWAPSGVVVFDHEVSVLPGIASFGET